MKTNSHDRTAIGAILVGTVGALTLATVFFAPAPVTYVSVGLATSVPEGSEGLTPYEVAPRIAKGQGSLALQAEYPAGSVQVWLFIDEAGVVQKTRLPESSGHTQLDVAALAMAGIVEFKPAMNRGENVPVWISLPITFVVR